MKLIKSIVPKALMMLLLFTVICGVAYPGIITGVAQAAFHNKANGSIIEVDGKTYGSALLAQQFTGDEYLWGRIMNLDTTTFQDEEGNPILYGKASNLSPVSDSYDQLITERVNKIKASNPDMSNTKVPVDLVTVSASGLDPHISKAAADYQVARIAKERGIDQIEVEKIIEKYTTPKFLSVFGEETVHVLKVNLALDRILE